MQTVKQPLPELRRCARRDDAAGVCSTLTWQSTGAQSTVTATWSTAALLAKDMVIVAIQPAGTEPALKACTPDRKHICSISIVRLSVVS